MKVAIVSTLPPINTSLSEYGKFLVEGLHGVDENLEIHVLADVPDTEVDVQEMELPHLKVMRTWRFNAWNTPLKLAFKLMALRPDVVLFNVQFASFGNQKIPAMLGLTAPALLRKLGFKVVTVLHNLPEAMALDEPYFAKNKLDKWLIQAGGNLATRFLLKSNRLVVTLDKYKAILEQKYQANNVDVIGLGSYIAPAQQLVIPDTKRLLTFGKFGTYKRLEFLLDTFTELSREHPDLELVIGGADHPATPGYMAQIQAQYGHLPNVRFIGWIEDADLPEIIRSAQALVLSYESTAGSSGPLHLALSQGKAIIAPDFGDFRLVAEQEHVEIMFYRCRDAASLADRLREVATGAVDLKAMGEHNLKVARENSSIKTAERYHRLLQDVRLEEVPFPELSDVKAYIEKFEKFEKREPSAFKAEFLHTLS